MIALAPGGAIRRGEAIIEVAGGRIVSLFEQPRGRDLNHVRVVQADSQAIVASRPRLFVVTFPKVLRVLFEVAFGIDQLQRGMLTPRKPAAAALFVA